ncbi:hypothetical protein KNP414_01126 [Paenibacillus mucilaginosus KNP414]|uniref:Uncharacterized protein n=1 Tax=Paenibacillus mucilaginosus (strain KNP414) TaxID=1036673 RepID=F8FEZ4_PAEMK|nr:hypothetical protein KNP414_01126 [Paenibacillus mucilaginosus KNP414]
MLIAKINIISDLFSYSTPSFFINGPLKFGNVTLIYAGYAIRAAATGCLTMPVFQKA